MAYSKTTWTNGATALSAEHMNNIELGIEALDTGKVDKVAGKGLSTNDYTTTEKNKLSGIDAGATNNMAFKTIAITGQSSVVADAKEDTLTLVAGSNVTLTTDATNDKITIAATNTTYNDATTSVHGLMSTSDKTKLNGIATGAEVNQNAFSNVKVGGTTIQADGKTDTLELVAGTNVTLTPDSANDKVTISMTGFIQEEGTDNTNVGGYYRKWSSGVAEYWWGWSSSSFGPSGSTGGSYGRTLGPFSFPTGLFIEKPKAFFNLDKWGTGYFWGNARGVTKDAFSLTLFRNDNNSSDGEGSFYAIGKWK